jgi:hypothetical protein
LTKDFPFFTPYQYASNTPIQAIDMDGLEAVKVVDHNTKTTTVLINVVYVPNSPDNPKSGSGFSKEEALRIQQGVKNEISKSGSFVDNTHKDSDGNAYKVDFKINFIEASSMDEAKKLVNAEKDRTVLLTKGGYQIEKLPGGGIAITMASTSINQLSLNSSIADHTNTHEVFHSIVHFSKNTPDSWNKDFDPNNQGPWHAKFGGIFQYGEDLPVSQQNVNDAMTATPTIVELPVMGPYSPEQQKAADQIK